MLSIRKLGFWGIRHPLVSLNPLVLDFADTAEHGLPVLVSLRNAGGKTTIIGLALLLLRPNLHEFLGQQGGKDYRLDDYLHHGLASHVIIEWDVHGTRVVTGVVMTKPASSDDPVRQFYAFVARPSRPDSPFAGLDALPVARDGRRLGYTAFLTALRAADKDMPEAEFDETGSQTEWHKRLDRLGIDPEVYSYQIRMNAREAAAHELVRPRDNEAFIDFLLDFLVDRPGADSVAKSVTRVRERLAGRSRQQARLAFVDAVAGRLAEVAAAVGARDDAAGRVTAVWAALRGAADQLLDAAAAREADAHTADECAAAAEARAGGFDEQAGRLEREHTEATVRAAEFAVQAATEMLKAAEETRAACQATAAAWAAVEPVATRDAIATQIADLDQRLAAFEAETRPLRDAVVAAGAALHVALTAALDAVAGELAQLVEEDRGGHERLEAAKAAWSKAIAANAACTAEQVALDQQAAAVDEQAARAVAAGALLAREDPAAALGRLAATATKQDVEGKRLTARLEAITAEQGGLGGRESEVRSRLTAGTLAAGQARDRQKTLTADLAELHAAPAITWAAEIAEPDPWQTAALLRRRLAERARADEAAHLDERAALAVDRSALAALSDPDQRLLPTPQAARAVIDALLAAGCAERGVAYGLRYLADSVPPRQHQMAVRARPELACGVVLADPADLPRARAALAGGVDGLDRAVAVATTAELHAAATGQPPDGTGALVVALPDPAYHDYHAAAGAEAARGKAVGEAEQRVVELDRRQQETHRAADLLGRFLDAHPAGEPDQLTGQLAAASQAIATAEQDLAGLAETAERLGGERRQVQATLGELGERRAELAGHQALVRGLNDAHSALGDLVSRRRNLHERAGRAEADINRHRAAAEREEQAAQARATRRGELTAHQQDLRGEHGAVAERLTALHADPATTASAPVINLTVARARYDGACRDLDQLTSADSLAAERAAAERAAEKNAKSLGRLAEQAVAAAERLLAADPAARDETLRVGRLAAATAKVEDAVEIVGQHKAHLTAARDRLAVVTPPGFAGGALTTPPATLADAETLAAALGRAVADARGKAADAHEQARVDAAKATALGQLADRLTEQAEQAEAALGDAPIPAPPPAIPAARGWDDPETVRATLRELAGALRARRRELATAVGEVERRAETAHRVAIDYDRVDLQLAIRLRTSPLAAIAEHAADDVDDLVPFRTQLAADLASIEADLARVVGDLRVPVQRAIKQLRRLPSYTVLPDGLGDWTGQAFLQIDARWPDRDDIYDEALARVIDTVVTPHPASGDTGPGVSGKSAKLAPIGGLDLVRRGVREAVGHRSFRVTILQPDSTVRLDRVPIRTLAKFSGGQGYTAAIILYCALVRARAFQEGRDFAGGGPLLLDNPFGSVTNPAMLDMFAAVARKLRVQLILFSAIKDEDAMATLGHVIRISPDYIDADGNTHLRVDGVARPATARLRWQQEATG
jgi:hypothetical protein